MMAMASGRPSAPARATDCGVPPEAIQTGKRVLQRARVDALSGERSAMFAAPYGLRLGADAQEEGELFGKERIVVVELVAEQGKRLDERAAPGHDLRTASRQTIEGGELLIDAHRIVGRQHRDGAREADALGQRGARCEHDRRGRDGVVRPMMLADAEHVEPDAVGKLDLLHEVGEGLLEPVRLAGQRVAPGLDEGVDAELHGLSLSQRGRRFGHRRSMIAWAQLHGDAA